MAAADAGGEAEPGAGPERDPREGEEDPDADEEVFDPFAHPAQAEAAAAAEALGLVSLEDLRFRVDLAVPRDSTDPFDRVRARQAILARELVVWYLAHRQLGPDPSPGRLREVMSTGRSVIETQDQAYLDRQYDKAVDYYESQS